MLSKLSTLELEALAAIQHDPKAGPVALSRRLKRKTHLVQYALKGLHSKGLLNGVPVVDTLRLGFIDFIFLLSVSRKSHSEFKKLLRQKKSVRWFADVGDGKFYVVISARSIQESVKLTDELSEKTGTRLFSKNNMAILLKHHCFERGYLYMKKRPSAVITAGGSSDVIDLDPVDASIIKILRQKAGESDANLAKALQLSQTTFSYRVRRLEKMGVICGYVNRISAKTFGMQNFKLTITTRRSTQESREPLLSWAKMQTNVPLVREVFGAWDFEVTVEVYRPADAVSIRDSLVKTLSGYIEEVQILALRDEYSRREPPF